MNGHVNFRQLMGRSTTTVLSLLLVMAVDSTGAAVAASAASTGQQCWKPLQRMLNIAIMVQKESVDLLKIYKASQGEMSELFCKVTVNNVPDPNISGMEPSERIESICTHLQAFLAHLRCVYEQQADLQLPTSPLLGELTRVGTSSRNLAAVVNAFYQSLFPNLPAPEPAGGATELPPPQNIFQQKVYGCVVLRTYEEFLSNVSRELRSFKGKVCRRRKQQNFF